MTDTAPQPVPEEPAAPALSPPTPVLRPIDIVRQRSKLARRSIEVPEWDMTLWFGKLTVSDMEDVGAQKAQTTLQRNLHVLIVKAELEDGTPAFATGDLHFLRTEADLVVVQRLLDFMFASAAGLPAVEKEADRIAQNPPSGSD